MEATEVFSKITYLKGGMEKLLAQGPAVSSADIKALLDAMEAKVRPTLNLDAEKVATFLVPKLVAKVPAFDASAVAKQLLPALTAGLPTPTTLKQAGDETVARLNQQFGQMEQRMQTLLNKMAERLTAMEQRVEAIVDRIPHTVGLDAFYGHKVLFAFFGVPSALVLISMFFALFMRVPREEYERVVASNDLMTDTGAFYFNQIKEYKRKFPKTAIYFRDYSPAPAAQPAESAPQ